MGEAWECEVVAAWHSCFVCKIVDFLMKKKVFFRVVERRKHSKAITLITSLTILLIMKSMVIAKSRSKFRHCTWTLFFNLLKMFNSIQNDIINRNKIRFNKFTSGFLSLNYENFKFFQQFYCLLISWFNWNRSKM